MREDHTFEIFNRETDINAQELQILLSISA